MQRHRLEVQSSNSTSPNTDNFHLIVVSLSFNGRKKLEALEEKQGWGNPVHLNAFLVEKTACYADDRHLQTSWAICSFLFVFMEMCACGLLAGVAGGFGLWLSALWKTSRRKITFWLLFVLFSLTLLSFFWMHLVRQIQPVSGFLQWTTCHMEDASTALWISMVVEKTVCQWRCAITFILQTARWAVNLEWNPFTHTQNISFAEVKICYLFCFRWTLYAGPLWHIQTRMFCILQSFLILDIKL